MGCLSRLAQRVVAGVGKRAASPARPCTAVPIEQACIKPCIDRDTAQRDFLNAQVIGTMGRIQLIVVTVLAALALAAPIQAITDADILNFAL